MLTRAVAVIAAMVVAVVTVSIGIGLTTPDGSVRNDAAAASPTTAPTSAPTQSPTPVPTQDPEPEEPAPSADLAPASIAGTWPGRPAEATVDGTDVDWCPAVSTDASSDAISTFGQEGVDAAACAAISFVFDHRYSRLSLPRDTYRAADFDAAASTLTRATADTYYRARIAEFVANQESVTAASRLGLLLQCSAGAGYTFYGPVGTDAGYQDRAVWINPQWSTVTVGVDRAKASPRLVARFTASAAIAVFDVSEARDAMSTVPTTAEFVLRHEDERWLVAGWTMHDSPSSTAPLALR